jgi:cysteine desulfurase
VRTYADYNATAPLRPEALAAMTAALGAANPSSVHGEGRAARRFVERAREQVAFALGGSARDLVFTGGGTEANALGLLGGLAAERLEAGRDVRLFVSAIEHDAVWEPARASGVPTVVVPVDGTGRLDLEALSELLATHRGPAATAMVALMAANNETGVIQPVAEAAGLLRAWAAERPDRRVRLHVDAVQMLGKLPLNATLMGADTLAVSAHKCGGPQGAGALWVRPGAGQEPLQRGGGQERSLRAGTENVPALAGFGAAAEAATASLAPEARRLGQLRDRFEVQLQAAIPTLVVHGGAAPRLPNTSNFGLAGLRAETQVMALDLGGVALSAGAACSSGKVRASRTLLAMGVDQGLAGGSLRASFGFLSEAQDFDRVAGAFIAHVARLRPDAVRAAAPQLTESM